MNLSRAIVVALMLLTASSASAQDRDQRPIVSEVARQVVLDPTTYVPTLLGWNATHLDWKSSQIFFQHGWSEHNSRFTVSGRADDTAIGYGAGNRQILTDALAILPYSIVNNASSRVVERVLINRFPTHRKLIRAIGWVERSAVASYWSYRLSAGHFRQWQENERRARQFGYR